MWIYCNYNLNISICLVFTVAMTIIKPSKFMVFTKPNIKFLLKPLTVTVGCIILSSVIKILILKVAYLLTLCHTYPYSIPHYISHSIFNRRMWSTAVFSGSVQQANQPVSEGTKRQAPSLFSYWWEHDGGGWGWRWCHRWERCQVVPSELWGMELRMVCRDTMWILTR